MKRHAIELLQAAILTALFFGPLLVWVYFKGI